jgi:hypothetical protein
MPLPSPPNVTVAVYRGSNAAAPYTLGPLVYASLQGQFLGDVQKGRFGSASYIKWTRLLLVDAGKDIRDAYNTQLDPARNNALGDTVVLTGSNGNKVAYYVVLVEQIGRGTGSDYLRVYLDRFQPQSWPTDAL